MLGPGRGSGRPPAWRPEIGTLVGAAEIAPGPCGRGGRGRVSSALRKAAAYRRPGTAPAPARCQPLGSEIAAHRRPLAGDDRIDAGVAQIAVLAAAVIAQNAVELGAEALDGAAAGAVEEMGAEFYGDAVQRLEGVGQQHALAFGVDGAALNAPPIPGGPDFDPTMGGVDVHIGGHAHRLAAGALDHGERQAGARGAQAEPALDVGGHVGRRGDTGEPQLPQFAVLDRLGQSRAMLRCQRRQARVASLEHHVRRPGAHRAAWRNGEYSSASQSISPCTDRLSSSR